MRRDFELIRRILLHIEKQESDSACVMPEDITGFAPAETARHMRLLESAGLIDADISQPIGSSWVKATAITWKGYDFLDHIRKESTWNAVKQTLTKKGIDMSIDSIMAAGALFIRQLLS
jgi:hypothetical protein